MRTAVPLLLAALAASGLASAAGTTSLNGTATAPAPAPPDSTADATLAVHYCLKAPRTATTISVATDNAPAWLSATYDPPSFSADTSNACGDRTVTAHVRIGRNAPALDPGTLSIGLSASGGGSGSATIPVQAAYAAQLKVTPPQGASVERGDQARFDLQVSLAANGGTVLEILGRDASGRLTIQGQSLDVPGAGQGLDQPVSETYHITVTASPGAPLGANDLPIELNTKYRRNPAYVGDNITVQVPLNVKDAAGTRTPGFAPALLGVGALGAAMLLRRRA
ncbi:MAG: hypothetical protein LC624_06340 [Halobacteriales archaeon]|nr:hypothetical protein [Halobacteriales archaeon]